MGKSRQQENPSTRPGFEPTISRWNAIAPEIPRQHHPDPGWSECYTLTGEAAKRRSQSWATGVWSSSDASTSWVATSGCHVTSLLRICKHNWCSSVHISSDKEIEGSELPHHFRKQYWFKEVFNLQELVETKVYLQIKSAESDMLVSIHLLDW